jgi:hypothetical protein
MLPSSRKQHHSEDYCEREVDEMEWQGGRVSLYLGAARTTRREASPFHG